MKVHSVFMTYFHFFSFIPFSFSFLIEKLAVSSLCFRANKGCCQNRRKKGSQSKTDMIALHHGVDSPFPELDEPNISA